MDQKEALRRGINAPASTAKIEVDPATLSPEVREFIANRLENGYDLTGWHFGEGLGSVIEPTVAGLVSQIEKILAARAEKELRRKQEAEATAAAQAKAIELARANPLLALAFANCSLGKDFTDEAGAAMKLADAYCGDGASIGCSLLVEDYGYVSVAWPDDVHALITAAANRINLTANAIRKSRFEAEHKARVDRLSPHFTIEEKEMHARGYLNLIYVEERLDAEAIEAIRSMITPPDYEIETSSGWDDRKPSSAEEFRLLKRIEQLTGRAGKLVSRWRGTRLTRVQIETTTADGRTLPLAIGTDTED